MEDSPEFKSLPLTTTIAKKTEENPPFLGRKQDITALESEYGHTFATGAILFSSTHGPDTSILPVSTYSQPFPDEEVPASTSGEVGRGDMITLSSSSHKEDTRPKDRNQLIREALPGIIAKLKLKQSTTNPTMKSIQTALREQFSVSTDDAQHLIREFVSPSPHCSQQKKKEGEENRQRFKTALPGLVERLKEDKKLLKESHIINLYRATGNHIGAYSAKALIQAFLQANAP